MKGFYYLIYFCLILACSTPTPYDHISSLEAREVLEKGINASGGLEAWRDLGGYKFNKRTILYNVDGSIEIKNEQLLRIKNFPDLAGRITWKNKQDTTQTYIHFEEQKAIKYIDSKAQSKEINEAARLTFLGAHIVMSMPFKLLDPGVKLTYGGPGKQYDKPVEILIADYNTDQPNHTKSHRWWHYFDAQSYEYLGYKVYHPPTYALIENLKTTQLKGIHFPTDRITWRVDSLDNKEYIRGKFAYSDFKSVD